MSDRLGFLRRRRALVAAYKAVFEEHPAGRLVLADLVNQTGQLEALRPPFEATELAYREGRRSIGLHLLERLRWSEGQLAALSAEQADDALEGFRAESEA